MKRNHSYILIAAACVGAVTAVALWPERTNALWGNTLDAPNGLVIDYKVHGYSSGEPIAAFLVCYRRGEPSAPQFSWSLTSDHDGSHEFVVAGEPMPKVSQFLLYFNKPDGGVAHMEIPDDEARKIFHRNAHPTPTDLMKFWKQYVDPNFEMPVTAFRLPLKEWYHSRGRVTSSSGQILATGEQEWVSPLLAA